MCFQRTDSYLSWLDPLLPFVSVILSIKFLLYQLSEYTSVEGRYCEAVGRVATDS
jgi:hypothetical protein